MQDRPTAAELLAAARAFCEDDLLDALPNGRVRFHVRVLINTLSILEREWEGEDAAIRDEWRRLNQLLDLDADEPAAAEERRQAVRDANAELSARLRAGDFDDRFADVRRALEPVISAKLAIANPRHAED